MSLPTPDAYNDAVQNPRLAFADAELANATVDCNGFGIPKALGGGFAITYRLSAQSGKSYAVRCFHKEVRNLQDRYSKIHSCLKSTQSTLFVGFEYQNAGIKVRGVGHPIVKMEWATGMTLGEYVERNFSNRSAIEQLRRSFAHMEAELAQRGIAHGDVQNGNILVSLQGQLRLVDYDGMFVPGMNKGGGSELGHKHFQHPARSAGDFTSTIDRFSFLVVDLSLWALTLQPDLFRQFSTGENILFSANDFADPTSSQVFASLMAVNDQSFQKAITSLTAICKSPVSSVPRLGDFLEGRNIPTAPASLLTARTTPQKYIGALPVVDASKFADVCGQIGDKVELVGKIVEVKNGSSRKGTPYVFINFGNWRQDCVRITLWSEGLKALGHTPDASWHGQWIVVNGLIDPVYDGKNRYKTITYRSVGITLSDRSQLHKVSADEALWRLGRGVRAGFSQAPNIIEPAASRNEDILQNLQGRPPKSPAQSWPTAVSPKPTTHSRPQTTAPSSTKAKNEAILKSLSQTGSRGSVATGASAGTQPGKSPTSKTGCLLILLISLCASGVMGFFGCGSTSHTPSSEKDSEVAVPAQSTQVATAEVINGRAISVKDGDTIVVLRGDAQITIRLEGIDCPEAGQPFGNKAKQATSDLAFDKQVTIRVTGKDRYGRTLAHVILSDGRELNRELVRQGYAWWFRKYSSDKSIGKLEAEARINRRGLWADAKPVAPWEWRAAFREKSNASSGDGEIVPNGVSIVALLPNPINEDAGKEWVTIGNSTKQALDLNGWKLVDKAGHVFMLSGKIMPGTTFIVAMGESAMPLNNDGDEVLLVDADGVGRSRVSYTASQAKSGAVVRFETQ